MAVRAYRCTLSATITVDEDRLKSAMLGQTLTDVLPAGTPPILDEDSVFAFQTDMLGAIGSLSSEALLQMLLVNRFLGIAGQGLRAGLQVVDDETKVDAVEITVVADATPSP